jgi:hypothetical protein
MELTEVMNTYWHDIPRKLSIYPGNKINAIERSTTLSSDSLYIQICPRGLVEHYTYILINTNFLLSACIYIYVNK